jgi:hypothetical protein
MWGSLASGTIFWGDHRLKLAFTTGAFVLAGLLTFATSFSSAGEVIYRWKDEAGNPVNSDRPPPEGIKYETISTSSSMVHAVDPSDGSAPPAAKPGTGKDSAAAPVAEAKAPATKMNPEQCARAKDNLTQLDTHARIRIRDDKGEVRFLSEEEKQAEKQKTLDAIKAFCG